MLVFEWNKDSWKRPRGNVRVYGTRLSAGRLTNLSKSHNGELIVTPTMCSVQKVEQTTFYLNLAWWKDDLDFFKQFTDSLRAGARLHQSQYGSVYWIQIAMGGLMLMRGWYHENLTSETCTFVTVLFSRLLPVCGCDRLRRKQATLEVPVQPLKLQMTLFQKQEKKQTFFLTFSQHANFKNTEKILVLFVFILLVYCIYTLTCSCILISLYK